MKVAVVGSRGFANRDLLFAELDKLQRERGAITMIISGGARGADALAEEYADALGIVKLIIKPDYERFSRGAPHARNVEIVKAAEMVVAFWDGESRGTKHTIETARKMGRPTVVINLAG